MRASFTQDELSKISGRDSLIISASKVDNEHSGVYLPRSRKDPASITIEDPSNPDTVVHEVVHHIRAIDKTKYGVSKAADPNVRNPLRFRDINNVEEAATIAEAAARTMRPTKRPSGYYDDVSEVKDGKKTRVQAYRQDRNIMTEGKKNGVVGKKAVESVNRNFDKTNISKKKLGTIQARNFWKNIKLEKRTMLRLRR